MKIVFAVFGSLGDMHPLNALGIKLKNRGHKIAFAAMDFYREKIEMLGFEFFPMRPHFNPLDKDLAKNLMDTDKGSENLLKTLILPYLRPMYDDLHKAVRDADLLISTEVVFPARSVAEKTGIKWITASLTPGTMFSAHDPFVPPNAIFLKNFRFLGPVFHSAILRIVRKRINPWFEPYKKFRNELGLDENNDPLFDGRSELLNLAMFSKVLGKPQPDWLSSTVQTGFCFYDGQNDLGKMPEELEMFLENGDAPIVFTLGSAAAMYAGNFFEESVKAAALLKKRAVLLYGIFNKPPETFGDKRIAAFNYAPYSLVFPKAACVVHQGGVGTTSQVLRAGVPHLFVPFSHDQPDNAARCERLGVARSLSRSKYSAESACKILNEILTNESFYKNAADAAEIIKSENGTKTACDAIENVLKD